MIIDISNVEPRSALAEGGCRQGLAMLEKCGWCGKQIVMDNIDSFFYRLNDGHFFCSIECKWQYWLRHICGYKRVFGYDERC